MPTSLHSLQFVHKMKKMNNSSSWFACLNYRSRHSTVTWVKFAFIAFVLLLSVAWIIFIVDPTQVLLSTDLLTDGKQGVYSKVSPIPTAFNQQIQVTDVNPVVMKKTSIISRNDIKDENLNKLISKVNLPLEAPLEDPVPEEIHFIHVPKCGGTSMTAVLRAIQCHIDPKQNSDCCRNPGFCDWHANRRCATIKGCINHFPNREFIFKPLKSIALFREPMSRLLSAWFYRGHNPNNDFFQVRPEFKEIRDGKRPKITFAQYLEMHEYQNILTRMLGADSFPYRNITITDKVFQDAVDAMHHLFYIALQEEFDVSVIGFSRELNISFVPSIAKERDQSNSGLGQQKADLLSNRAIMRRAAEVNSYDIKLYQIAVERFCSTIKKYPDLYQQVLSKNKVYCNL